MSGRSRAPRVLVALCAVVVAVVLGQARVALADEGLRVEGMDYFYGSSAAAGSADSSVDILSVSGAANQTVYVEMDRDGVTIASHLAFTLGDSTAKRDDAGRYVGVVSAKIANFQPLSTYGVRVFADREQTQSLFEGGITPVFADLDGAPRKLLALRTVASGDDRAFTAPANVTFGNASYKLASDAPVSEAPLAFSYTQSDAAESIDGVVRYVDAKGKVLRADRIPDIAKNEHRSVPVPSVITVGEGASASWWRTVGYAGSVNASYPGVSDFTVRCVPLASGEGSANAGNYYFAGIRFVDAATGRRVLAPSDEAASTYDDSLNVCGRYLYTPPTRLFATDANGVAQTYVLNAAASHLSDAGALELDSAKDGVTDGFKSFDVTYDRQPSDAATTWTVVIVNGAADPKGSDREIARRQFEVRPGETATFTPDATLAVGDRTFVPVTSTKESYSYTFGAAGQDPVTYVYYVPDDYVAPAPYDVTVRYVNYATGEVLAEKSVTSRPELRDELEIDSPESFFAGDTEYVRLAGQEEPIWHSYYSSARAYTIYYRDSSDDLAAARIVRVRVIYADGAQGAGSTTSTSDGVTTVAVPSTEAALTAVDGAGASGMADGSGADTNEVRIEDNETPLAQMDPLGPWQAMPAWQRPVALAGIGVGIVAVLLVAFLLMRRRRSDEGKGEQE